MMKNLATVRRPEVMPDSLWLKPRCVPTGLDIFVTEIYGEGHFAGLYRHRGEVVMDKGNKKTDTGTKNHR
jgi:hypothetical protein